MVQWFEHNFDDRAHGTSYITAEGGYLWNHGGPFDAEEQLYDKFGDIVSESLIKQVVEEEEVESDGFD